MTLLAPSDYVDGAGEHVLVSAGRAAFGVDIKTVDDAGAEVAPGDDGELLIRGRNLMSGYWRDPQATAALADLELRALGLRAPGPV